MGITDWSEERISNLAEVVPGGTPPTNDRENWNGDILWATPTDITATSSKYISETARKITKKGTSYASPLLPVGSILLCTRATIGESKIASKPITTNQGFKSLVVKEDVSNEWLYYVLQTKIEELKSLSSGSTFLELGTRQLKELQITTPKYLEQKAIAEALSDIDEFIANSKRLFNKKINVMEGLVGELVSAEYFKKIGANSTFDTIKNLGIEVKKGDLITEKTAIAGKIPVIAGGVSAAYYHNTPNRTGITITISASGANAGYVNIWKQPIWASDCSTISESSVFDVRYLYYVLKGNQENIYRSQYGGAQPHVRPNEIEKIVIPWAEKRHQKEIADLLDDFSDEIKDLETSIQKHECLKQGMMNDLLTGKVRLV